MKRTREVEEGARYFGGLRAAGHHYGNLAVELLSNGDILQTMLRERPYTLLKLLSSAKVLYGLLQHVSGFWFEVLHSVIVKETGETNWAFYVWEWHTGPMRHWMARVLEWQRRDATMYEHKAPFFAYLRLLINVERPADGADAAVVARYRRQMPWAGDDRYLQFDLGDYDPMDFWQYDEEQGWTPDMFGSDDEERRENDQVRAMLVIPEYRGRGADILAPDGERGSPSTSLCEIASYRMRDESHDGDAYVVTPLSVLPLGARQAMCRIYTYFHPFALGPFELLDTRRLWMHRLYVAFLSEGAEWVVLVFAMDAITMAPSAHNVLWRRIAHADFYGQWIVGLGQVARFEHLYGTDPDQPHSIHDDIASWDMEKHMQGADEAVVARIQRACDDMAQYGVITGRMPVHARETPKPDFTQTRALLAEGMPAAGSMLELAPYAQLMRQRYAEPGAARRLLEREMRYLERTKGGAYMVTQYGRRVNVQ